MLYRFLFVFPSFLAKISSGHKHDYRLLRKRKVILNVTLMNAYVNIEFCIFLVLFGLLSDKKITYFFTSHVAAFLQTNGSSLYSKTKLCIIFRKKTMINDMTAFILKTIIIRILSIFKADHLIKFSVIYFFYTDLIRI